jgi:hypothetical protein
LADQTSYLNAGHIIADVLKPIFTLIRSFELHEENDNEIILVSNCERLLESVTGRWSPHQQTHVNQCQRLHDKYVQLLSKNPLAFLTKKYKPDQHVCFPVTIMGDKLRYTFQFKNYDVHDISFYRSMRELAYKNLKIKGNKQKQITLYKKIGNGHKFSNHEEILNHLTKKYKDWKVVELDPLMSTKKKEISTLSKTAIFIAPSGGIKSNNFKEVHTMEYFCLINQLGFLEACVFRV